MREDFRGESRHQADQATALYPRGRSELPPVRRAFHDITAGDNTVTYSKVTVTGYQAKPGWDPVTGWGSPDAQFLVPLLAAGG